jgi:lactate racemase
MEDSPPSVVFEYHLINCYEFELMCETIMVIGTGLERGFLSKEEIRVIVRDSLDSITLDGKRVIVLIPDNTRTMPMPLMFDLFEGLLSQRVSQLDYLVALGTHQPLDDAQLSKLVGRRVIDGKVGNTYIYNHEWDTQASFVHIGTIHQKEINQITGGLLTRDVPVQLNKRILEYDQIIICGPVFPHEVVGFSGGNKYFFPGIAGPEIINFTHWLGALITSYKVIGTMITPVREVIDQAAEFVTIPTVCFSLVVTHDGVTGVYFGSAKEAWQAAARLSSEKHIIYKDRMFKRVLSIMPEIYDDLWTAAKGMYKLEPIIEDGGEVIIYAPHIHEVSYTHGKLIDEIGYHCRDYFLSQWDKYKDYPGGVLAHSTHLKGLGIYDLVTGIETPRIQVTLATRIPAERCRRINLGYLAPTELHMDDWQNREGEGILVAPHAGEMLYRIRET